jgi:hypothetical protein
MRVAGNFHPERGPHARLHAHGPHRARSEAVGAAAGGGVLSLVDRASIHPQCRERVTRTRWRAGRREAS